MVGAALVVMGAAVGWAAASRDQCADPTSLVCTDPARYLLVFAPTVILLLGCGGIRARLRGVAGVGRPGRSGTAPDGLPFSADDEARLTAEAAERAVLAEILAGLRDRFPTSRCGRPRPGPAGASPPRTGRRGPADCRRKRGARRLRRDDARLDQHGPAAHHYVPLLIVRQCTDG